MRTPQQESEKRLEVKLVEDTLSFQNLRKDWDDLYLRSPRATPFQSFGWLFSWWRSYALEDPAREDLKLKLLCIRERESGLLIGLLPFMIRHRNLAGLGSFGVLEILGSGITDYLDMLVGEGFDQEVCEQGAREVIAMPGWSVADFRQLRPESAVFGLLQHLNLELELLKEDGYPQIEAGSWEEALGSVSSNLRSTAKRSVKRLSAEGARRVPVPREASAERLKAAARRFVSLHRDYWRERNISPEHLEARFESHVVSAALLMVPEGSMEIREFVKEEEVFASQLLVLRGGYVGHLLSGAKPEAVGRYQVSSLFIHDGYEVGERLGAEGFDLLRGEEPYKLRWTQTVVPGGRVIFARKSTIRLAYAKTIGFYSLLRRYTHSEIAHPKVKRALVFLASLRSRLVR